MSHPEDRRNACPECGMYIWAHPRGDGCGSVFSVVVLEKCKLTREQAQALYDSRHPQPCS